MVNVLTLERIFETRATFRSVEADRNIAHVSKIRSKVSKFTINSTLLKIHDDRVVHITEDGVFQLTSTTGEN